MMISEILKDYLCHSRMQRYTMRLLILFLLNLFALSTCSKGPDVYNPFCYRGLDGSNPLYYGAYFDGIHDDSEAIQKCIDENNHVVFRGDLTALISKSLIVHSGTWLDFDPNFRLKLANNSNCPLIKNQWADQIFFLERNLINGAPPAYIATLYPDYGPSYPSPKYKLGNKDIDIKITGGILDGNGANQTTDMAQYGCFGYTGRLLTLVNVDSLLIENTTLYDPKKYFTEFCLLNNFIMRNITLGLLESRKNQDGLHFDGECYNGIIDGVFGKTWDDMVALNGGDGWYVDSDDPNVHNIIQYPYKRGKIANIKVSNVTCNGDGYGFRGIRLLSNDAGSYDETEGMEDIFIDGVFGEYAVDVIFISKHLGGTKKYKNLNFKNILGVSNIGANHIWIEQGVVIEDLVLSDSIYESNNTNKYFINNCGTLRNVFLQNIQIKGVTGCESQGIINNTGSIDSLRLFCFRNIGTHYKQLIDGKQPSYTNSILSDF